MSACGVTYIRGVYDGEWGGAAVISYRGRGVFHSSCRFLVARRVDE